MICMNIYTTSTDRLLISSRSAAGFISMSDLEIMQKNHRCAANKFCGSVCFHTTNKPNQRRDERTGIHDTETGNMQVLNKM